jgi:hypothetical protein
MTNDILGENVACLPNTLSTTGRLGGNGVLRKAARARIEHMVFYMVAFILLLVEAGRHFAADAKCGIQAPLPISLSLKTPQNQRPPHPPPPHPPVPPSRAV